LAENDHFLVHSVALGDLVEKVGKLLVLFVVIVHNVDNLFDVIVYCEASVDLMG